MTDVQARIAGEDRAQRAMLGLLCGVSIGREALTGILPVCGASAWWVTALSLLPGFAAAGLFVLSMGLTHASAPWEAVRRGMGRMGVWLTAAGWAVLLLLDGVSSMTVLTTLFTQGIGTRGTQLTLALLTGAILLCSLHREGLPRGIYLLRWGMGAAACVVAVCLLPRAHADHLFPVFGDGAAPVRDALRDGVSLGWPVMLFLRPASDKARGKVRRACMPALAAVASILLLNMIVPHEALSADTSLSGLLLLPLRYAPNALRVVGYSLMMLALFLSIGASAQLAAQALCVPSGRAWKGLPYVLVGLLIASQTVNAAHLWRWLECLRPWLLLLVLCAAAGTLISALFRRKRV